jgi:L-ornithine N5-oxygenase
VHDIVGVGFGPSNLALAIAVEEHNRWQAGRPVSAVFLERQRRFGWHRGMLIDTATMQVSFLKDLVTMRDPTSEFSFLAYLHSEGRLADFINHKTIFPTRIEFHDYLEWVARSLDHLALYDAEVVAVRPVEEDGVAGCLEVETGGAEPRVLRARNVVLALGLLPTIPPGAVLTDRVWHNYRLLTELDAMEGAPPRRFVVVGAGQSAAETTEYLHRRFPEAEVHAVFARYGYSTSDDTSFANRIFDPDAVNDFYAAPEDVKQMLLEYHGNTNYSVVDPDLIDELYRRTYQEKVSGERRLRILNACRLADVRQTVEGVQLEVEHLPTKETFPLDTDVLVYATGYTPGDPGELLGTLGERTADGELCVDRDYRLLTDESVRCGIYLQGPTEHSHGISSTLLSTTAIRAGEILRSVTARLPAVETDVSLAGATDVPAPTGT